MTRVNASRRDLPPTLTFPIPNDDVVVADAADDEEEDDVDDSLGYGDD